MQQQIHFTRKQWFNFYLLALLVKTILFILFHIVNLSNFLPNEFVGGISILGAEVGYYYIPIERLIDTGQYGIVEPVYGWHVATRMPGWLPIYGPLYFLFGQVGAHIISIIFQVLADALAVVVLAVTAKEIFNDKRVFYIAFFVYAISAFVSNTNHFVKSDSFCGSFAVFSLFFFVRAVRNNQFKDWLLSGVFIGWSTFMRPATGAMIPAYVLIYFIYAVQTGKFSFQQLVKNGLIFTVPFVLCITAWACRNYRALDKVVLATTTNEEWFYDQPHRKALWDLIPAWGGALNTWGDESYFRWFLVPKDKAEYEKLQSYSPFNEQIFTPDYNLDSLKQLRQYYWLSWDSTLALNDMKRYQNLCAEKAYAYLASYKKHHFFYYCFGANLKLIKEFLFVKQTFELPFMKNTLSHRLARAFYFLLYYFCLHGFFAGIIFAFIRRNKLAILLPLLVVAHVLAHAVALGWIYNWYLIPVYPIFVIYACYAVSETYVFITKAKKS